jgi:hypothetical protein
VAIYRDGVYVGRGQMNLAAKTETVRPGFGADEKVKVTRATVRRPGRRVSARLPAFGDVVNCLLINRLKLPSEALCGLAAPCLKGLHPLSEQRPRT